MYRQGNEVKLVKMCFAFCNEFKCLLRLQQLRPTARLLCVGLSPFAESIVMPLTQDLYEKGGCNLYSCWLMISFSRSTKFPNRFKNFAKNLIFLKIAYSAHVERKIRDDFAVGMKYITSLNKRESR